MKVKYIRNKKIIKDLELNTSKTYASINQAKRASRQIQIEASGRIGKGILEVAKQ